MPKVGKMKFPYTEQGIKEAASYAKNSGKAMEMEGGGMIPKYQAGGMVPNRGINPRFKYGLGSGMAPRMRPNVRPGMRPAMPGMRPRRPLPGTPAPRRHPGGPGGYHVRYKKGGKVK